MTKTLRDVSDLAAVGLVSESELAELVAVSEKYAIAISPHLQGLLEHEGIKRQFVPDVAELIKNKDDLADPIGDQAHSPIKGLIHRYPDRCLMQPVTMCPVYCRFCFRRETVGQGNSALSSQELNACYGYIQQHPEIWEVILSGGDPLILKPKQLQQIITNLDEIKHVEIIRIHTRIPTVDPQRINPELLKVLTQRRPIYVVLHINHPEEFVPAAIEAINKLADHGIVLLGQSVLLKGINDNIETLGKLFRGMVKHRIKPYYLHHVDLAPGISHFRTTIAHGQELMAQMRGAYSGVCQPQYVLDIPGGAGKSPIGPSYLKKQELGYQITNFIGQKHFYTERS